MPQEEEIKQQRFQFLQKLCEMNSKNVTKYDVGDKLGFDSLLTERIFDYLSQKGLVKDSPPMIQATSVPIKIQHTRVLQR